MNIQEKKENALQSVLQILSGTSEKINILDDEASIEIRTKRAPTGYKEKLSEKAQLLIHLPQLLQPFLQNLDSPIRQEIVRQTEYFAAQAKEAVEISSKSCFSLRALLTWPGSHEGDKNDLEKLIFFLERKEM